MYPFKRILFPVDYSEPCEAVVPYVREMVHRYSADLTLIHAFGPDAVLHSGIPVTDPNLKSKAEAHERTRLRNYAAETFLGQRVECIVELCEPGAAIHKVGLHQGTDLVMLATNGHGPVRRFLLGSVTAQVLHDLGAAVWTGTGMALMGHEPLLPYKSILCAIGDSAEAECVLMAASSLAASYEAHLSILHVVEAPPAAAEIDYAPYRKDLMDAADFHMRELKARLEIEAPHSVIGGNVAHAVRDEALLRKADLVVTGRGLAQGNISRMWSHLYPIVRQSPCPVISI